MLRQLLPFELSLEEIDLYDKAVATYPQSGGVAEVSRRVYDGTYGLYVLDCPNGKTLAIVSINSHPDGSNDLFIVMLSGDGTLVDFDHCLGDLKELAASNGCERVTGMMSASTFSKLSQLHTFGTSGYVVISYDVDE